MYNILGVRVWVGGKGTAGEREGGIYSLGDAQQTKLGEMTSCKWEKKIRV